MVLPPRTRNMAGDGRRNRVTLRVKNEIDGMIYTLVFEGSLDKLFVRQLKRHIQDTAGVMVNLQLLMIAGRELVDDKLCSEYGMRDGQILTLVSAEEPDIPRAGVQPQQLPPPGAVFPPPPPKMFEDNLIEQPAEYIQPIPAHLQAPPMNIEQPAEYIQPIPAHLQIPPMNIEQPPLLMQPSYEVIGHQHHQPARQPVMSHLLEQDRHSTEPSVAHNIQKSDQLVEKLRENNVLLRDLQRNEAELHHRELELSSQERIFRKQYEEAQNSRLTEAQLKHHQDVHIARYENNSEEENSVIVGIEEIPPSPTHNQFEGRRSEEKRISPPRLRQSVPLSSNSSAYPARSKSATEQTVNSARSFEIESGWKSSCTKFDLQRSHNASQMDKMQQQLLERQAELDKHGRDMKATIQHTQEKRRIIEELKLKCTFG